jgi:hypothetical protein
LLLYGFTLAPGLTWAHHGSDGGDFLAAALVRGIPHPSGYPTYVLLLRALTAIVPGDPARTGNWLSAICAALGISVFAFLANRMLAATAWRGLVALSAALCLGASPALWGQATITEVHGLNFLLVVSLMALLWLWMRTPSRWWPPLAGLVFGLSLGNHLTTLLLIPAAADWLWHNRRSLSDRTHGWLAVAAAILGLSVYLYLPLAAAKDPPVNWGDPQTPQRFLEVVSVQVYRPLVFGVALSAIPGRLAAWGNELARQFGGGLWGALIAVLGAWLLDRRDHLWWRFTLLVVIAYSLYAIGYDTADSHLYLIPVWAAAALWLAEGLNWLAQWMADWLAREKNARKRSLSGVLFLLTLIALPVAAVWRHGPTLEALRDTRATDFLEAALTEADQNAVIFVEEDARTFALWYGIYGLQRRSDLTPVNLRLYAFPWYRRILASHHPQVLPPESVDAMDANSFVAELAGRLPVYRAGSIEAGLTGLAEQRAGALVKLTPQ